MPDFSTSRLQPASSISSAADDVAPRDTESKVRRRTRPPARGNRPENSEPETIERPEEATHRVDDLA